MSETSHEVAQEDQSPPQDLVELAELRRQLKGAFLERDEVIDGALMAMLAHEHMVMIGPKGSAKSQVAYAITKAIRGKVFTWLLTRFTVPEEIFGPYSAPDLLAGRYERITTGKLPEATCAFMDECYKANSAILNSLLTIMNERQFDNGTRRTTVPLAMLIGASNELPEDERLEALHDRFMVRFMIQPVSPQNRQKLLLMPDPVGQITAQIDLPTLHARVNTVKIPEIVIKAMVELSLQLDLKRISVSDRRWRKCLGLLRAMAVLDGRDVVQAGQISMLGHVLWENPDDIAKVQAACNAVAHDPKWRDAARATGGAINPSTKAAVDAFVARYTAFAKRLNTTPAEDLWKLVDELKELEAESLNFHAGENGASAIFGKIQKWSAEAGRWAMRKPRGR